MKTAFFADMLLVRKSAVQTLVIMLVVGVFVGVGMNTPVAIVPITVAASIASMPFTLFALDEQNSWEAYRSSLPLTRGSVIWARALAIIVTTVVTATLGAVLTMVIYPIAIVFPGLGLSFEGVSPSIVAFGGACAFALCSVLEAVLMPLAAKFGLTKGVRFIPLAFLVIFFLAIWALNSGGATRVLGTAFESIATGNLWPVVGVLLVVALAIYAAGAFIAAKLYETREF